VLPPLVEPGPPLTPAEVRRYSRHLTLPGIGMAGQRRLKNARVLVVGAGGLGSPALLYLAAAGVGTIGVVDDDLVDESNLQRQVVHGQDDVGRPKVDSAAEAVARVNPLVTVVRHQVRLDSGNALDVLRGYDVVLDGTDTFPARYLLGDATTLLGLPCVWGSIYRFDGQVAVFWGDPRPGPDGIAEPGVTYRDVFPEPPPPGLVPSCEEGGVLGVLPAAIGSVMATEAIKLICGTGEPLLGRLLVLDALDMSWRTIHVRRSPETVPVTELVDYEAFCGLAGGYAGSGPAADDATISATDLAGWLAERERGTADFVLVDVREAQEREIVRIPGAVAVPVGRFRTGEGVAEVRALAAGRRVVLHCKSGSRSAEALAVLRAAGFTDAVHVAGGVLAWVAEVDPELPRY
jgi:molybdopterin/thiamine biosynthesis adenylyltransferase/rhodanese-related sulfurtransferase